MPLNVFILVTPLRFLLSMNEITILFVNCAPSFASRGIGCLLIKTFRVWLFLLYVVI